MQPEKSKDFFVSYNQHDRSWAEWIAWQLEAAAYTTKIQAWDFRPGSNFVVEMHSGLASCDRILLVLSNSYLQSGFGEAEWAAIFSTDPQGLSRRIIPVRVQECSPDGLLRSIVWIDLVGMAEDAAKEALLSGVLTGRSKPARAPQFPSSAMPAFPPTATVENEPGNPSSRRIRYVVVLSGTVDEVDGPVLDAILEHLKKITRDSSLTLRRIEPGSVRVFLEGTESGFRRLRELSSTGILTSVGNFDIEAIAEDRDFVSDLLTAAMPTLRKVATHLLRGENSSLPLEPEDLVQEAFAQLARRHWVTSSDLLPDLNLVANAVYFMRMALVTYRKARASKRHHERRIVAAVRDLNSVLATAPTQEALITLDEALTWLARNSAQDAAILEMRYLAGMSSLEIGAVLELDVRSVVRRSRFALSLVRLYLEGKASAGSPFHRSSVQNKLLLGYAANDQVRTLIYAEFEPMVVAALSN